MKELGDFFRMRTSALQFFISIALLWGYPMAFSNEHPSAIQTQTREAPRENPAPKLFVATKAFINYEGKILILRESEQYADGTHAGFFDVVGGRLEPGEGIYESLRREIKEETGLDVRIGQSFFASEWWPTVKGERWQVVGIFFECFADSDQVRLGTDHDTYRWIEPEDFERERLIPKLKAAFEAYSARIAR
jgi:8-oxo-dGTP diphosphatase